MPFLHMTETLLYTVDHNDNQYNVVIIILRLLFNSLYNRLEVQCNWKGFVFQEPTWDPRPTIRGEISYMLYKFLQTFNNQELVAAARAT